MDFEGKTLPLDNGDAFHVYADSCLVCNQQCYLRPSFPNDSPITDLERERIVEIRGVIYQAFDIQVGQDFVEENKTELPLCPRCTFKLGQLRHVHYQLASLQREYNKLREEIAFSIVDLVAGSEDTKSSVADVGAKSPNSFLQCMKESEVETIQHLVFEAWHERYSEDEPEKSPKQEKQLPTLKNEKVHSRRSSLAQTKSESTPGRTESPLANPKASVATTAVVSTSATAKSNSNGKIESTTKIISITTSKDNTLASVEVSNEDEDQEVENINEGSSVDDDNNTNDQMQDDSMVIAMSPTQFCATSECSSPDPSRFLQGGDGESENDLEDEPPFKIRQFAKIKSKSNGSSVKFPNDLEVTEWSSDDSQQGGLELDYRIFEPEDDSSQDFDEIVAGGSKRLRIMNSEIDLTVDNNSLGNIEFQQNEEGLYVCMFCSKTFIHKYPYRDHLKTHTGEGPRCPVCSKIFPKNHNLILHMRTHTGEKPYKCMVCSKGFADKSNLKVHMRVHTGERPYKCEYCDQAFVNSSRLVVHRRLHTGEKPFMCDLCNRCFGTSNQLQTHRKSHYEDKGYKCNDCGKSYTSATTLQAHVSLMH